MNWPISTLSNLFHVGYLDKSLKRNGSYEGSGLSMSTHPDAWKQINPPTNGHTYSCIKAHNQFLDYYALTPQQKEHMIEWGVLHGWVTKQPIYRLEWYDDEYDNTFHIDYPTQQLADEEMNESHTLYIIKNGFVMTPKMQQDVQSITCETMPIDLLAVLYSDKALAIDGVWWDEQLDVSRLSAPRGVISLSRLNEWQFIQNSDDKTNQ